MTKKNRIKRYNENKRKFNTRSLALTQHTTHTHHNAMVRFLPSVFGWLWHFFFLRMHINFTSWREHVWHTLISFEFKFSLLLCVPLYFVAKYFHAMEQCHTSAAVAAAWCYYCCCCCCTMLAAQALPLCKMNQLPNFLKWFLRLHIVNLKKCRKFWLRASEGYVRAAHFMSHKKV